MPMLVIQIVIKQWDKSQRSEEHVKARAELPTRYPINVSTVQYLYDRKVVLNQHGDDVMGNRIRYELTADKHFLIDRFDFDLNEKTVDQITQPDSLLPSKRLTTFNNNWMQCQYEGRYKVFEGGFHYWLYESVTLNAGFCESLEHDMFMASAPDHISL